MIAEAGLNHNGCITLAKQLVDVAAEAGANAVKFQKRTVDVLATPDVLDALDTRFPEFGDTYREIRDHLEFNEDEYLEIKDYINLIRSAGFRPGIEPLRIKRFQYRFIADKENNEQILAFTLFNTKTKPKHQLTCHPYFTKNIFPEILNRHSN